MGRKTGTGLVGKMPVLTVLLFELVSIQYEIVFFSLIRVATSVLCLRSARPTPLYARLHRSSA